MTLLEGLVLLLMLAGAYFVGRLLWIGVVVLWFLTFGAWRQRALLASEIAGLSAEQIRERLLGSPYFASDLRRQPPIEEFLSRIARHDEIALRAEYSRRHLYSMLSKCERAARRGGRPEASDYIDELYALLDALAQRARLI
jgi:hypothetical protein